jgi:hypothetical protein
MDEIAKLDQFGGLSVPDDFATTLGEAYDEDLSHDIEIRQAAVDAEKARADKAEADLKAQQLINYNLIMAGKTDTVSQDVETPSTDDEKPVATIDSIFKRKE